MRQRIKDPVSVAGGAATMAVTGDVKVAKQKKQPLLRVVKKDRTSLLYRLFVRVCAVGFALLIMLLYLKGVTGYSFLEIWQ